MKYCKEDCTKSYITDPKREMQNGKNMQEGKELYDESLEKGEKFNVKTGKLTFGKRLSITELEMFIFVHPGYLSLFYRQIYCAPCSGCIFLFHMQNDEPELCFSLLLLQ